MTIDRDRFHPGENFDSDPSWETEPTTPRPSKRVGKTLGALVGIVLIFFLKMTFRAARNGGNPGPPPQGFGQYDFRVALASSVLYVNDSPAPCMVELSGIESGRRVVHRKELPAGPGHQVIESVVAFRLQQITVESDDQRRATPVRFELPRGGLARIQVTPDLQVTPRIADPRFRAREPIAEPEVVEPGRDDGESSR